MKYQELKHLARQLPKNATMANLATLNTLYDNLEHAKSFSEQTYWYKELERFKNDHKH